MQSTLYECLKCNTVGNHNQEINMGEVNENDWGEFSEYLTCDQCSNEELSHGTHNDLSIQATELKTFLAVGEPLELLNFDHLDRFLEEDSELDSTKNIVPAEDGVNTLNNDDFNDYIDIEFDDDEKLSDGNFAESKTDNIDEEIDIDELSAALNSAFQFLNGEIYFGEKSHEVEVGTMKSFGITLSSRYHKASELSQMLNFTISLAKSDVHTLVESIFFDSKANFCSIELYKGMGEWEERRVDIQKVQQCANMTLEQFDINNSDM
jgi:hypothetical protein